MYTSSSLHAHGSLLTAQRLEICQQFFLHYENEGEVFLHSIVTDEVWVYHYESEIKCQSVEYQYKHYFFYCVEVSACSDPYVQLDVTVSQWWALKSSTVSTGLQMTAPGSHDMVKSPFLV